MKSERQMHKSLFKKGGEMGSIMRSTDWRNSPLGVPNQWPIALVSIVNLILNSKFPMFLFWGPQSLCFYNDAYRPSLGRDGKHPKILGLPAKEAWPEIWETIQPMISQILDGKEGIWMDDALIPIFRNNVIEDVYWTFSYSPVYADSSEIGGALVTCMETTDKVLHLQALRDHEKILEEKEAELRAITSASPVALWLADDHGNLRYINQTWINWTGKPLEYHLKVGWTESIHPDDRDHILNSYKQALEERKLFEHDFRVMRSDGSFFWSATKCTPLFRDDRQFIGYAGSCMDITERKHHEEIGERYKIELETAVEDRTRELRIREAQLSQAHSMANMASWEWEFKNDVLKWSPEMFKFWGYEPKEIEVNFTLVSASTYPEDLSKLQTAIKEIRSGQNVTFEYRRYNKWQEIRWIRTRAEVLRDKSGALLGAFGIDLDITEEKNSEQNLRMLNLELQRAHAIAKMGSWSSDYKQRTYTWSDDMYRLSGYEPGEISLDLEVFGNVHPEDLALVKASHRFLAEVGEPIDFEFRRLHKDGRILQLVSKGEPILDERGGILGAIGVNVDITELRTKEKLLAASELLNKSLLDILPNVVYIYDLKRDAYKFSNRSIFTILGYDEEQSRTYESGALMSLVHPEDRKILLEHFALFSQTCEEPVFEVEYRCRNKGGSYQYLLSRHTVYARDKEDRVTEIIGMITDITDQRNVSLELQAVNTLLSNKNQQLEQQILTDFSESFALYKTGSDFFHSLSKELGQKCMVDYVLLGKLAHQNNEQYIDVFSLQIAGRQADSLSLPIKKGPFGLVISAKSYQFIQSCQDTYPNNLLIKDLGIEAFAGYPLLDSQRKVIGIICLMHGKAITHEKYVKSLLLFASKRVEMELERLENEAELARKNRRLEQQNDDLMSFNRVASHDLQEPLRKIQMFLSRFDPADIKLLSQRTKTFLEKIKDSAARMQLLIDDLMTFSSVNQIDTLFEPCDLNDILDNCLEELNELIQEKNAVIKTENSLPRINAVPYQIHQLFSNIISNALKYSRKDFSPEINIQTRNLNGEQSSSTGMMVAKDRGRIELSFSDNGIGFDEAYKEKIFTPFSRLHNKNDYPGSGIGLAICKKIVDNHAGKITAESPADHGATVRVVLPK